MVVVNHCINKMNSKNQSKSKSKLPIKLLTVHKHGEHFPHLDLAVQTKNDFKPSFIFIWICILNIISMNFSRIQIVRLKPIAENTKKNISSANWLHQCDVWKIASSLVSRGCWLLPLLLQLGNDVKWCLLECGKSNLRVDCINYDYVVFSVAEANKQCIVKSRDSICYSHLYFSDESWQPVDDLRPYTCYREKDLPGKWNFCIQHISHSAHFHFENFDLQIRTNSKLHTLC